MASVKQALVEPSFPSFALPQSAIRSQRFTAGSILASDILTLSLVFGLAVLGRHLVTPTYRLSSYFELFPCVILLLCAFWLQGLYPAVLIHPAEEMRRVFFSMTTVFLVMASATFLWRNAESYSRLVFLVAWLASAPTILISRYFSRRFVARTHWWGVPAVVLGSGPSAQRVIRTFRDRMLGIKVIGVLSDEPVFSSPNDSPPLLGGLSQAPLVAASGFAHYAIVAMPQKLNTELLHTIQDHCRGFSHVLLVPDMPGMCSLGISTCEIGGEVGFELPQRLFQRGAASLKRAIDLVLAFLALSAVSPFFLLIWIVIGLTSREPVFYTQTRYGKDGKSFSALKFRTMVPNAENALTDYLALHPQSSSEWQKDHKLRNDPRVTRVGKWLRRFSLDELPQLINVLAGQMSMVGPRPIVEAEIPRYGRGYSLYTRVRPGLTGLWQVSGRNNTTYAERVAFDEYYVHNWSVWLDAYILVCTLKVVATADGAF